MSRLRAILALFALVLPAAASSGTASDLVQALRRMTLDPDQTYRVREISLRRGGVSFYFNEGALSFAAPIGGRRVAAVFSTSNVEAGDAEVLLVPPQAAERASLASFAGTPNLDEHIRFAVLYFSDNTCEELLNQITTGSVRKAPELATQLDAEAEPILQHASSQVSTRIIASLLDAHPASEGFLYATVSGRDVGPFDIIDEPSSFEPITIGRLATSKDGLSYFQPWTSYRPRQAAPYHNPPTAISNYGISTVIQEDLTIAATAEFDYVASLTCGRVIALNLSRRMDVAVATIDGLPVEVLANHDPGLNVFDLDAEFLLVARDPLLAGRSYHVTVRYSGAPIRQVSENSFFVSERNLWYPHTDPMLTTFDLTFRCPQRFEVVASGELIDEKIENGERIVHRKTLVAEQLAGFNVGEYQTKSETSGRYRIEAFADPAAPADMNGIPAESAKILETYTRRWVPLPIHTLALTPIPGKFGQGFPGLIYLARMAYIPESDRPPEMRNARQHVFFSELLLPHELAHQWWGNMITAADYRAGWLMEAMANYSALQYIEQQSGKAAFDAILEQYRQDLNQPLDGKRIASIGPVDFGFRLMTTFGASAWQIILYEKGTWILHMLHERLGDEKFAALERKLLEDYSGRPISNEEFQKEVSAFVPAGQPDKTLTTFFDSWVYGTGVPEIKLKRAANTFEVSGVGDDFAADVPFSCNTRNSGHETRWQRVVSGLNSLPAACSLPAPSDFLYDPLSQ
jgi:Peptidase family M1 domain